MFLTPLFCFKKGVLTLLNSDESEAFSKAIREMAEAEDEEVVIFYDELSAILEVPAQNQAIPITSFQKAQTAHQNSLLSSLAA